AGVAFAASREQLQVGYLVVLPEESMEVSCRGLCRADHLLFLIDSIGLALLAAGQGSQVTHLAVFPQESVLLAFGCIRSSDDLGGRAQSGHQAVLAAQRSQVQALAALPEQAVDGAVVSLSTIFGPGDLARSVGEEQEVALLSEALWQDTGGEGGAAGDGA